MPEIVELQIIQENMYAEFYPLLREKVFHFTSGKNLNSILMDGHLIPIKDGVEKTSAHSHESMGKLLNAVCLFDLRSKSIDQIEKIRGWYNFLMPRFEENILVYCIVSKKYYKDIKLLDQIDTLTKEKGMYLPHLESWHVNPLPLSKLEVIYKINLI